MNYAEENQESLAIIITEINLRDRVTTCTGPGRMEERIPDLYRQLQSTVTPKIHSSISGIGHTGLARDIAPLTTLPSIISP